MELTIAIYLKRELSLFLVNMKNWLLLFLLCPLFSLAQDCKLKKSSDPFNHETRLSTGFMPFNNGALKISLSIDATPALVDFFIWIKNDGFCFDDDATAEIIFEGEKAKMRLKNSGTMNCEGAFHFSFRNTASSNSQLAKIASKKISTIKLTGNNKAETTITLTDQQKELLMNSAACAMNEGKTLIKQ
jgi:hypothetical protein